MTTTPQARPAVFLDRDGTIIEDAHYVRDPEKVILLPGAAAALRTMRDKGYLLFVISNQSGVGRGIISDSQFEAVHRRFCELLAAEGVEINQFLYCFHRPEDDCGCRKPRAGLIPREFDGVPLAWDRSFTVGDKDCDLFLARPIGAKSYLVLSGKGAATWNELKDSKQASEFKVFETLGQVAADLPPVA
jgi:histidinol-phosphate phosphatase family protein